MHVRVVAPSSPFDAEDARRGIERLRERYQVTHDAGLFERHGYLAGDDARRARELLDAIEDPSVHAILAARGGYGATRLLPQLPVTLVAHNPKLLIGFSDITALHALWARAELGSIHGPMAAVLGRSAEPLITRFVRAIEGELPGPIENLAVLASGSARVARGRLAGGNLAVLSALVGTPYMPNLDGTVLFLEDIGERPYRVDRMLTSLLQSGALDGVIGIALGVFTNAEPGADGVSVQDVLTVCLSGLRVPFVSGVPAGHVDDNLELPLGSEVVLDASTGSLRFEELIAGR
jgi:muramoyltetrapeptide carboxypeptidase